MENLTREAAQPIVPPRAHPDWERAPSPRRRRRRAWPLVTVAVVALALVLGGTVTLPYYAIAPGSARQINDLIAVPTDRRYPPSGDFLLTTVSLRRVTAFGIVGGWIDPDVEVVHEERLLGPVPRGDFRQLNIQEMLDSKEVATVVALRHLGYEVVEQGDGALVSAVMVGAPAHERLEPGEAIVAVDGAPVSVAADLLGVLATKQFGDEVTLTVDRGNGTPRTEIIRLGGSTEDRTECLVDEPATGRGCLGVGIQTKARRFNVPFEIAIDSAAIGGPSAGLAFGLALIDSLSPGELTGGKMVAVTGTLDLQGRVGNVGGVAQKTAAVRAAGADVFLVPAAEYEHARARAGSRLRIVPVDTIETALAVLRELGGDAPTPSPAAQQR